MKLFFLMGPTASGKTALACEWVRQFPFEIISVDSAMIYRGMDIGTAKPSAALLAEAPHHLIDICDPVDSFSVAEYCECITALVPQIYQRGHVPLLVGGTMMYFHALQQGMHILPKTDPVIRAECQQVIAEKGIAHLYDQLLAIDPMAAARIHRQDTQRIQRAVEVFLQTGRPWSSYLTDERHSPWECVPFALFPQDRKRLHQAIETRFLMMLTEGFLEEVRCLKTQWSLTDAHASMRCVGYRQALEYLTGEIEYDRFIEKSIVATRQLAKRQLTWLRHWKDAIYVDPYDTMMHNKRLEDLLYLEL